MKKVLILTYYFPPAGGAAVQRVLKFVKYLQDFNWHPVVLTARERDYVLLDNSLVNEIPPQIPVYRVPAPDLYGWYGKIGQKSNRSPVDLTALLVRDNRQLGWIHRLALGVRSTLFIPDARIGWLPTAFCRGLAIARKEKIKAIFATSPPFTTALLGGLLGNRMDLPWISDYRDPWTQAYFYFKRPGFSRRFEEWIEKHLLGTAASVISINQRLLSGLEDKYTLPTPEQQVIIPNGYDPADFEDLHPVEDDHFTITYTGTLHVRMNPAPLLEAVAQLRQAHPEFEKKVGLTFIGRISHDMQRLLEDPRVCDVISVKEHMDHKECLQHIMGAELLLLLIPDFPGNELHMSGKLFEYMRAGKPILCLADQGDAADVIRATGSGFAVAYEDVERMKSILWDLFKRWQAGRTLLKDPIRWDRIATFDRRRGTKQLAQLLDRITESNSK
jgi:glycosyltransferase involved in cell wall biosynthesis